MDGYHHGVQLAGHARAPQFHAGPVRPASELLRRSCVLAGRSSFPSPAGPLPSTSHGPAISRREQEQPSSSTARRRRPLHGNGSSCSHSQVEQVTAPRRRIDRSLLQALVRRPAVLRQFRNRTRCSILKNRTHRSRNRLRAAGCRGHGGPLTSEMPAAGCRVPSSSATSATAVGG
jgi:hypothetical protein